MNKKDILILVALFALWLLWAPIDRLIIKPLFFPDPPVPEAIDSEPLPEEAPRALEPSAEREPAPVPGPPDAPALRAPDDEQAPVPLPVVDPEAEEEEGDPPETMTLRTERMSVSFSSRGATIKEITLWDYPELNTEDSGPVILDFAEVPALAIEGLSGLTERADFEMTLLDDGHGVTFHIDLPYGLRFERVVEIAEDYLFNISDTFVNTAPHPLQLPSYRLRTGRMEPVPGVSSTYGMFPLGVDTLSPAESVSRWAKDIQKWVRAGTTPVIRQPLNTPVDWVAVKNKYFVQILRPRSLDTENAIIYVERDGTAREMNALWASLQFPQATLDTGGSFTREAVLFAGPQQLRRLQALGYHQDRVMELGWAPIRFFASLLMFGLTALYGLFGNYGVAIMLLTVIIRIFFWPLTHKGTESMRRMQEIAPLMKELNEKYKDEPQKRQQAMMELYKEHKVNPLGGCLPMIVQIPVFIGLFYLLRTSIELRYAGFLWISDLSEPEGLLGDVLPLPINILPIFMAVTMFFQQKLTPTPSAGDERQQQMHTMMMRVMPVMMLVLLYNFASGLALYWSTQNVLMIVQQILYRRRLARKKAAGA